MRDCRTKVGYAVAFLTPVSQLQSILTPEVQQALTTLVRSSMSDDTTTVVELKKRLELQLTRNARLEEELVECRAQLVNQKGLKDELERKNEELEKVKKSLATAEMKLDELDVADVSGLLVRCHTPTFVADANRAQTTLRRPFLVSLHPRSVTSAFQTCDRVSCLWYLRMTR